MRKAVAKSITFYFTILLVILTTACAFKGPYRCYLGKYHGRIYDVETDKPIEGVVIHITYSIYGSSPAGAIGQDVAVRETLTDANGEYLIPEDIEMHECFSGKLQGDIQIFKPGYGYLGKAKLTCPEKEKEVVYSSHGERICVTKEGKYLIWGLPKLKTKEERLNNIRRVHPSTSLPMKNQPLIINAINQERRTLGLPTGYVD